MSIKKSIELFKSTTRAFIEKDGEEIFLTSFIIDQELNSASKIEGTFFSKKEIKLEDKIKITVLFEKNQETLREEKYSFELFNYEIKFYNDNFFYFFIAYNPIFFLSLTKNLRVFAGKKYSQILKEVLGGIKISEINLGNDEKKEIVIQYEDDLSFVKRICKASLSYFLSNTDGSISFVTKSNSKSTELEKFVIDCYSYYKITNKFKIEANSYNIENPTTSLLASAGNGKLENYFFSPEQVNKASNQAFCSYFESSIENGRVEISNFNKEVSIFSSFSIKNESYFVIKNLILNDEFGRTKVTTTLSKALPVPVVKDIIYPYFDAVVVSENSALDEQGRVLIKLYCDKNQTVIPAYFLTPRNAMETFVFCSAFLKDEKVVVSYNGDWITIIGAQNDKQNRHSEVNPKNMVLQAKKDDKLLKITVDGVGDLEESVNIVLPGTSKAKYEGQVKNIFGEKSGLNMEMEKDAPIKIKMDSGDIKIDNSSGEITINLKNFKLSIKEGNVELEGKNLHFKTENLKFDSKDVEFNCSNFKIGSSGDLKAQSMNFNLSCSSGLEMKALNMSVKATDMKLNSMSANVTMSNANFSIMNLVLNVLNGTITFSTILNLTAVALNATIASALSITAGIVNLTGGAILFNGPAIFSAAAIIANLVSRGLLVGAYVPG